MSSDEYGILDRDFSELSETEKLAVWNVRKWLPYSTKCFPATPPTSRSIARIESSLGIRIPSLYIELAKVAPNYGVWFGSIGTDYESPNHILSLNEAFHKGDEDYVALSQSYVLLNHGHDGQCDCWNLDELGDGEHPIYHIDVEVGSHPRLLAKSFKEYWLKNT